MSKLGPYDLDSIVTGDARELAAAIPDESVDLVFTDPVYWQIDDYAWLAEMAVRVLKPGGSVLAYAGHVQQIECAARMMQFLTPRPMLTTWMSPPYPRLFGLKMHVNYSFVLWFSKGKGTPKQWVVSELGQAYQAKNTGHMWGKNFGAIAYYVEKFTNADNVILDPFTGGATVPAVCKMLGRHYLAFEIDPATAERARERVHNTQPPLFVPAPEQAAMFAQEVSA
jgi:DNA modification methylase